MSPHKTVSLFCLTLCLVTGLSGCTKLRNVGQEPEFTPPLATPDASAMMTYAIEPTLAVQIETSDTPSLWTGERGSLLGDRRAIQRGDILTVVIEIDDSASISNSTGQSRSGSEQMSVPSLFGIPQRLEEVTGGAVSLDPAVQLNSSSTFSGDGTVRRNEQLELRVAATIVQVMPNGVLAIEGNQEVRVNYELRELLVSGFVRPGDISRQNEITYDKIASARISYGGRGQITNMQQSRYGQQIADAILPF